MKREKEENRNDAVLGVAESGWICCVSWSRTASEPSQLREEWARRIREAELLTAMTRESFGATSVYNNYVE